MTSRPVLFVVPGGPGLSCDSLSHLSELSSIADLVWADLPNNMSDWSYEAQLEAFKIQIPKDRSIVFCGHSAGGIFATDLALQSDQTAGLVLLATPFSEQAFRAIGDAYVNQMTAEIKRTEARFEQDQCDEAFTEWLGSYGSLYFISENADCGNQMIRKSRVLSRAFIGARAEIAQKEKLAQALLSARFPMVYIYGVEDGIFKSDMAVPEAQRFGLRNIGIPRAGHFMAFDNPVATVNAIEDFLKSNELTYTKGET